eukprot:260253-Amphidinium_carterae.1
MCATLHGQSSFLQFCSSPALESTLRCRAVDNLLHDSLLAFNFSVVPNCQASTSWRAPQSNANAAAAVTLATSAAMIPVPTAHARFRVPKYEASKGNKSSSLQFPTH